MSFLAELDRTVLLRINQGLASETGDTLARFFSTTASWWALGLAAVTVVLLARERRHVRTFALALLAMGVTDFTSTFVLKPAIARVRPCHEVAGLRPVVACGKNFSLPSNHAANGAAVVGVLALRLPGPWTIGAGLLAAVVGLSRVYLGVHYPLDILGGFAVGLAMGLLVAWIAGRLRKFRPVPSPA